MYRRYTQMDREGVSPGRFKQTLIRDIIIVLLLAGLIVLLIKAIPAFNSLNDQKSSYIRRMAAEYSEAANLSNSDSISLSEMRSKLYAIRILNDLYTDQYKQPLIDGTIVDACIEAVRKNLAELTKGATNNTLPQMELRDAMEELNNELNKLN